VQFWKSQCGPNCDVDRRLECSRNVLGVKLNWAYGPGEVKILSSSDGGNFEEAACWRAASRSEVSYEEAIMFDSVQKVKALTIVMKAPMPWGYFGLNDVSVITSGDEPFMVISGASSRSAEQCLTARGSELSVATCLNVVASGDGRDVFKFRNEQIVHVASNMCIAVVEAGTHRVGLVECSSAAEDQDGRSAWQLTANAQLKMPQMGNYCLSLEAGRASARDCSESFDKFFLSAVPELDQSAAIAVTAGASLLLAAAERQREALTTLQGLLPSLDTCGFASIAVNASHFTKPADFHRTISATVKLVDGEASAMAAIGNIYAAVGVDIAGTLQLVSESSNVLANAEAKIARSA